jgi:hypothetical protein
VEGRLSAGRTFRGQLAGEPLRLHGYLVELVGDVGTVVCDGPGALSELCVRDREPIRGCGVAAVSH